MELIKVEITFKQIQFVKLMESLGVFDIKNGSVRINFNDAGEIGVVEVNRTFRV